MISQEYDKYKLVCDDCYRQIEKSSFEECIAHMRKVGWETENDNGNWYNYCPDCRIGG